MSDSFLYVNGVPYISLPHLIEVIKKFEDKMIPFPVAHVAIQEVNTTFKNIELEFYRQAAKMGRK